MTTALLNALFVALAGAPAAAQAVETNVRMGRSAQASIAVSGVTRLQCLAHVGGNPLAFSLEFDDTSAVAKIDGGIVPASFTASHATLRPSLGGPVFFLGRSTGRLLVADAQGATLGMGHCVSVPSA